MANHYFQFKQFKVEQSLAAMKVCTEACVFGALAESASPDSILDIGAGTGLLSLMLAQKFNCPIDAVEIEEQAFLQTKDNFERSPWKDRLTAYQASIQTFSKEYPRKYDFIIANPPFFTNHLQAASQGKNLAIHNNSLSQKDLLHAVIALLSSSGSFYLLLPPSEAANFDTQAIQEGLFLNKRIIIYNRPGAEPFRYLSYFSFQKQQMVLEDFLIRNEDDSYSKDFVTFLKPYYLYL